MRRLLFVAVLSLTSIGVLAAWPHSNAQADDLTSDQASRIQANCVSIKSTLTQLHATDTLLRVNRGQVYEAMASKLMDTFNGRLGSNQLDNQAMVTVTSKYRSALDVFRADYITYEQKLVATIKLDCVSNPSGFHRSLLDARDARTVVHSDVQRLHRIIDDYRSSVSDFLLNYERVSN